MSTAFRRSAACFAPVATVLVTLLAIPAGSAAAQATSASADRSTAEDAIPRELALALLNLGPGSTSRTVLVGKAPQDIPIELIPPGSQVLGSMIQYDNSVTVLAMPHPPDSAVGVLESQLTAAGWTRPQMRQPQRRGFVGAPGMGGAYDPPDILCRNDEFVTLSGTYRRTRGSLLKVSYNRGRYSMCRQMQQRDAYRTPWDEAPMPTLRAPADAMTVGGGGMSSTGQNQVSTTTRLSTRLKPAEVLAHYDSLMRSEGWNGISDGAIDMLAARTYRKKDDKGREWTASLSSIARPDSGEQDVVLHLERR